MNKRLYLVVLLISYFSLTIFAETYCEALFNGLKPESDLLHEKVNVLRKLRGDTIRFDFFGCNSLTCLKKQTPDTVWIENQGKKKNKLSFSLSYAYKRDRSGNNLILTPVDSVNNRLFGVLSVETGYLNSGFSSIKESCIYLKLVDLVDLSTVDCLIPDKPDFGYRIYSNRLTEELSKNKNSYFYLRSKAAYNAGYQRMKLDDPTCCFMYNPHNPKKILTFNINLVFVDDKGETFTFSPWTHLPMESKFEERVMLTEKEYTENVMLRKIDSSLDSTIIAQNNVDDYYDRIIVGIPKKESVYVSQTVNPTLRSPLGTKHYIPSEPFLIAGEITVKDETYLKAISRGKAFFVAKSDILLTEDGEIQLNSLAKKDQAYKDRFFNMSLYIGKLLHKSDLENGLRDLHNMKNLGLCVRNISVYPMSSYVSGKGLSVNFYNPTEKTIKYISFDIQGYNGVGDRCGRRISHRCIGPINPDTSCSYEFDYVWMDDVTETAKISNVLVTYSNGQTKSIPTANKLLLTKNLSKIFDDPFSDFN